MIIDANSYWFDERIFTDDALCEQFLSEVPREYNTEGRVAVNPAGKRQIVIEKPSGAPGLNYIQGDYTLEKRLADMDEAGVDKAILKLPGCHEWMSLDMCRRFNDGMAADAAASGGRLIPLVAVPPFGAKANLAELDRRLDEGFAGVQLCAHYGERYLDDSVFASFFEHLNERGVTAYVHHVPVPVESASLLAYDNLRRSYGRCVDQTTAIGREIFSDFFERYPNVRMVHSMLGGAYFAFKEMLLPHGPKRPDVSGRFQVDTETVSARLEKNIFFDMSHAQPWGPTLLSCAVEVLGADHIVFGTSYPVKREWLTEGVACVNAAPVSDEARRLMLGETAQRLYGIE